VSSFVPLFVACGPRVVLGEGPRLVSVEVSGAAPALELSVSGTASAIAFTPDGLGILLCVEDGLEWELVQAALDHPRQRVLARSFPATGPVDPPRPTASGRTCVAVLDPVSPFRGRDELYLLMLDRAPRGEPVGGGPRPTSRRGGRQGFVAGDASIAAPILSISLRRACAWPVTRARGRGCASTGLTARVLERPRSSSGARPWPPGLWGFSPARYPPGSRE